MAAGVFVAVVGPSGAGKDTLISHARDMLRDDPAFLFVRRIVTRPSNAFEAHDSIDEAAFRRAVEGGDFALSWTAHGLGYALPRETCDAYDRGAIVISNLSRGAIEAARQRFARVRVVAVTASPDVLATRLSARGRESLEAVRARLQREAARDDDLAADLTIWNDRAIEQTGAELVSFLRAARGG